MYVCPAEKLLSVKSADPGSGIKRSVAEGLDILVKNDWKDMNFTAIKCIGFKNQSSLVLLKSEQSGTSFSVYDKKLLLIEKMLCFYNLLIIFV